MIWVTLIATVLLLVLQLFLRPKPSVQNAKPAGLGDFTFPTATEGRAVPVVWGTVRLDGPNVIWYGDFEQEAIIESAGGGGGLFGGGGETEVVIGFKYFVGIQFALCRGPIDALTRVWINEKIVFDGEVEHTDTLEIDEPELFGGDDLGNGGIEATMRLRAGTVNQNPGSYISQFQKQGGDTPGYRLTAFLAPDDDPIYVGNSPNIAPWSFEVRRIPTGPATGDDEGIGQSADKDANPVNVIYEILTNKDWGLGEDPLTIDVDNFAAVGAVLAEEVNGWSFVLDQTREASDVIALIEEQIDGTLFQNQVTGLWQINLARDDYDPGELREITADNRVELVQFSRGSWEDTTNQVRVGFTKRGGKAKYKDTFAVAQDGANFRIQGGTNILSEFKMPGCMRTSTANDIAWRELRQLSYPLATASVVLDRSWWDLQPVQVVAFTDSVLGFIRLPMRIRKLDFGDLENNRIRVELIEDVFAFGSGKFSDPTDTGFDEQEDEFVDYPTRLAFEAPRAFVTRDPALNGELVHKVWCAARRQLGEPMFKVATRSNNGSAPSGDYSEVGKVFAFMLVGELTGTLAAGTATPTGSILVTPDPDSQLKILQEFVDGLSAVEIGINLRHLILVGDEFMLVTNAQASSTDVQLNNVYRGALDSVQVDHAAGEPVYLLFAGGSMIPSAFAYDDYVDVKLLPKSISGELDVDDATAEQVIMDDRLIRPYCPSKVALDGTDWASTVSLEADGADAEDFAFNAKYNRRDFRYIDEVESLLGDAADVSPSYPLLDNPSHSIQVRNDPDGTNDLLLTIASTDENVDPTRLAILLANAGALPTRLRLVITALHDTDGKTGLTSRSSLTWDFDVTSALTGQHEFGALDNADVGALYTATVAGTYAFTLSSAFSVGDVEYRLNAGSWTTLVSAGGTSGSIVGVAISDTIEVRHLSTDSTVTKQLDMAAAGAGQDAFAILYT